MRCDPYEPQFYRNASLDDTRSATCGFDVPTIGHVSRRPFGPVPPAIGERGPSIASLYTDVQFFADDSNNLTVHKMDCFVDTRGDPLGGTRPASEKSGHSEAEKTGPPLGPDGTPVFSWTFHGTSAPRGVVL